MKKILLSMALMAFIGSANAQLWFGGSVGYNSNSTTTVIKPKGGDETKSKPVSSSFSFSPKVGFQLGDAFEVGAMLTMGTKKSFADKEDDKDNWMKTTTWALAPFARYSFATFGKFSLKAVGELSFGQEIPKSSVVIGGKTEKDDGDKTTTIALNVYPMMSYTLSDHFDLEASLNFFGLSASSETTKDADNSNNKVVEKSFSFFGNSNTVLTSGFVTVGFIYKL